MKILGIDPGIGRVGWALLEQKGKLFHVLGCGTLETDKNDPYGERLVQIYVKTTAWIKQYQPDEVAVEELFFDTNAKTAFAVGQARGVILLAAAQHKIEVTTYTPLQVKLAVAGYGKADKKQVGQMVKAILQLQSLPKLDDTTDALAIALTHGFSQKILKQHRR